MFSVSGIVLLGKRNDIRCKLGDLTPLLYFARSEKGAFLGGHPT